MELPYMISEQFGYPSCCDIGRGWYNVSLLGQTVYHYHDSIIASARQYFRDQIDRDDLPTMIWDSIGHELAGGQRREGLRAITQVATLYVVRYVTTHPRPQKVTGNEFSRFPSSRVSSYWVIVVGFHNVKSELTVTRDVDLSSIEY